MNFAIRIFHLIFLLFLASCAEQASLTGWENSGTTQSCFEKVTYDENLQTVQKNSREEWVLVGTMLVQKINYNVHSVMRKVEVADGYRGSSWLIFTDSIDTISYQIWNGECNFEGIQDNKLILTDEQNKICREEIKAFDRELIFSCGCGQLIRE